jgi:electron transfer flavoprotein beta subunit
MKIVVPVKRVLDPYVKVRVKQDNSGVDLQNAKMAMNPFCEIAVEQAIRLKEQGKASEVVVAAIGPQQSQETLRTGLAMGADRGILVKCEPAPEPLGVAKLLKAIVEKEDPGIVFLGKQAVDDDNSQTGQMLSALLGWAQGTFVSKVEIGDGEVDITREIDGGLEMLKLKLPCVLTADLRLCEPRYASLPNIMKAKKKPIDNYTPEDLGIDVAPRLSLQKVEEPPARKAGIKVESVEELVDKLHNEAKVL